MPKYEGLRKTETIKVEASQVIEVFEKGTLLARAMDGFYMRKSEDGVLQMDTTTWEEEIGYLKKDGLNCASSTLLLPNEKIHTYKACGILYDGDKSELIHVSEGDSRSSGSGEDFYAGSEDLKTLQNLQQNILKEKGMYHEMNEVNANFTTESVLGVFFVKASSAHPMLNAYLAQQVLKYDGFDVPLFEYDAESGKLVKTHPTPEEIMTKLDSMSDPRKTQAYTRCVEKLCS